MSSDLPDHSLKIFKADQHFRYLLVHKYTSAREVVMLALQEFGISECSSNFALVEVTVDVSHGDRNQDFLVQRFDFVCITGRVCEAEEAAAGPDGLSRKNWTGIEILH